LALCYAAAMDWQGGNLPAVCVSNERGRQCLVPENSAGRRLLTRTFTLPELEHLNRQPEFLEAIAAMQTLCEFENVVKMGHKLLIDHFGVDYPRHPIQREGAQGPSNRATMP
jgi:hypothetical protein